MAIPLYLQLSRHGIYYFRLAIPGHLRPILGKRELKLSLGRAQRREAIRLSQVLAAEAHTAFERLTRIPSIDILNDRKENHKNNMMQLLIRNFKRSATGEIEIGHLELDPDHLEKEQKLLASFNQTLANPNSLPSTVVPTQVSQEVTPNITIRQIVEEFCAEKEKGSNWVPKTHDELISIYGQLVDCIGDIDISQISRETARSYKRTLQELPPNIKKSPKYRGKSIEEVIALKPKEKMSVTTINKYLARVSALFEWAKQNGYVRENHFQGLKMRVTKRAREHRVPFSKEDIKEIFTRNKPNTKHPHRYWVPLIAHLSGARIEEICQLNLDDIREQNGIWVIDINDKDGKHVKTMAGIRLVPIHSILIKNGLIEYVDSLRKSGEKRLFPKLKADQYGKYSKNVGKWFGDYIRDEIGITEGEKVFHSFRHGFINDLKQKGVRTEEIADLVGHEGNNTTIDNYGKRFEPEVLLPIIESLDYSKELHDVKKWGEV